MSGAASFVLGLLGLGVSAGINVGQSIKQKKATINMVKSADCTVHQTCCECESVFVKSGGMYAERYIMLVKNL